MPTSWPAGPAVDETTGVVFLGFTVWGGGGGADLVVDQSDGEGVEYGFVTYWVQRCRDPRAGPHRSTAWLLFLGTTSWCYQHARSPVIDQLVSE